MVAVSVIFWMMTKQPKDHPGIYIYTSLTSEAFSQREKVKNAKQNVVDVESFTRIPTWRTFYLISASAALQSAADFGCVPIFCWQASHRDIADFIDNQTCLRISQHILYKFCNEESTRTLYFTLLDERSTSVYHIPPAAPAKSDRRLFCDLAWQKEPYKDDQ